MPKTYVLYYKWCKVIWNNNIYHFFTEENGNWDSKIEI